LLAGNAVRADIIPSFNVATPVGGGTEFSYSIDISAGSQIMNESDAQTLGRPHGTLHASFFTIYDFNGYVAGSAFAPADWDISVQNVGQTPTGQLVNDNASVVNITFTYTGAITVGPVTHYEGTGVFGAVSTSSVTKANGQYTSSTIKNNPPTSTHPDNLTFQSNQGFLVTPSAVPETSSLMLLLPGLVPLGVVLRRRARK
jgi:hypothetical protein